MPSWHPGVPAGPPPQLYGLSPRAPRGGIRARLAGLLAVRYRVALDAEHAPLSAAPCTYDSPPRGGVRVAAELGKPAPVRAVAATSWRSLYAHVARLLLLRLHCTAGPGWAQNGNTWF